MAREKEKSWKLEDDDGKKCGCVVTDVRYVSMCPTHEKEHQEIHDRWAAEKIAGEKEREAELAARAIKTT